MAGRRGLGLRDGEARTATEITSFPLLRPEQRRPLKHRPITTTSPRGPCLPRPPPDAAPRPGKFLLSGGNSTEVRLTRRLHQLLPLRSRKPPPSSASRRLVPTIPRWLFLSHRLAQRRSRFPARRDRAAGERCALSADVFLFVRVGFRFLH